MSLEQLGVIDSEDSPPYPHTDPRAANTGASGPTTLGPYAKDYLAENQLHRATQLETQYPRTLNPERDANQEIAADSFQTSLSNHDTGPDELYRFTLNSARQSLVNK